WIAGSAALVALVAGLSLAWWSIGWSALLGVVIAQLAATVAVARGLASPSTRFTWAYGLIWVLPVLLFQLHYDMPLPFDNRWLLLIFAAPLALAALGLRPRFRLPALQGVARLLAVGVFVPLLVWITPVAAQPVPQIQRIRLMT